MDKMENRQDKKIAAKNQKRIDTIKSKTNEETMSESVRNIITATMEGNAIEVQSAIHTAIGEKIKDALEAKRVIVAQNLVGMGEAKETPKFGSKKATNKNDEVFKSWRKEVGTDKKTTNKIVDKK